MIFDRPAALITLVRELATEGGISIATSAAAKDSQGNPTVLFATTFVSRTGDVIIKISRGVSPDGPLWAEHLKAVQSRLASIGAFQAWTQSMQGWIVWGCAIAALISTAAAIADEDSHWIERLLRMAIPSIGAALVRVYIRPLLRSLTGALLRRILSAQLRAHGPLA